MPPTEPTNERLQQWRDHPWAALNGSMSTEEFLGLVSALLAVREELDGHRIREADAAEQAQMARDMLAERDSQIAALRHSLHQVFQILRGHDCAESILISAAEGAAQIVVQERDSLRGELEATRKKIAALQEQIETVASDWQDIVADRNRELEAAKQREAEWDETLKTTARTLGAVIEERDAARTEAARLRELYENLIRDFESGKSMTFFPGIPDACREAITASADSAKWLEERLIETHNDAQVHMASAMRDAEKRGYERGKAEENEAYEREVFRQIAKAKAEGEIAGLQQAADFAIDCNLDTFAHSLRLKAGNREHDRQLAERRRGALAAIAGKEQV